MRREKPWYVYILECGDGTLYTGATNDVERRLEAHIAGKGAKYTKGRRPLRLVYTEECTSCSQALSRECAIKKITRSEKYHLIQSRNTLQTD